MGGSSRWRVSLWTAMVVALVLAACSAGGDGDVRAEAEVITSIDGLRAVVITEGLDFPVAVDRVSTGEVFIAEKSGIVKYVADATVGGPALVVADLRDEVHEQLDRGMVSIAAHPEYPDVPYVYVLYTRVAPPGGEAPTYDDECPRTRGEASWGCVVGGRVDRLEVASGGRLVRRDPVVEGAWCHIQLSHSVGDLAFGPDGLLYVSAGEGASFDYADDGRHDDEFPSATGTGCGGPAHERGAFRAQAAADGDTPRFFDGAVIRVDVDDATPTPELVAYGLRNPFRLTFQPGTSRLWIADVGWTSFEEVDVVHDVDGPAENFGWPCREGFEPAPDYSELERCIELEDELGDEFVDPVLVLGHGQDVPGCPDSPRAITDLAFVPSSWGSDLGGSLLAGDYGAGCIFLVPFEPGDEDRLGAPSAVVTDIRVVDVDPAPDDGLLMVDIGTEPGAGRLLRFDVG